MSRSLQDCPAELVLRILCHLSLADLNNARLVAKFYNTLIKESVLLQYIIQLETAGYVNDPSSSMSSTYDRLRALKEQERAWLHLRYKHHEALTIPRTSRTVNVYDLSDNHFIIGSGVTPHEATELKVHRLDVPSSEPKEEEEEAPPLVLLEEGVEPVAFVPEDPGWRTIARGMTGIIDVGLNIVEHNLIVIVRKTRNPAHDAEISILRFSDGEPHPFAMRSTLNIPKSVANTAPTPMPMTNAITQQIQALSNLILPGPPPPPPPPTAQLPPILGPAAAAAANAALAPNPFMFPALPPALAVNLAGGNMFGQMPNIQPMFGVPQLPHMQAAQATQAAQAAHALQAQQQMQGLLTHLINSIGATAGAPFGGFHVAPGPLAVAPGAHFAAAGIIPGNGVPAGAQPQPPPNAVAPPVPQVAPTPAPAAPQTAPQAAPAAPFAAPPIPGGAFGGIQFFVGPMGPLGANGLPPGLPPGFPMNVPGMPPGAGQGQGFVFNVQLGIPALGGIGTSRPQVCIEVVGDVLAVLYFGRQRRHHDRLIVWNWKTGERLFIVKAPWNSYCSLIFLAEDVLCLPNMATNHLEIYKLPLSGEMPVEEKTEWDLKEWEARDFKSKRTFDPSYGPPEPVLPPPAGLAATPAPVSGSELPPADQEKENKAVKPHPRLLCCLGMPKLAAGAQIISMAGRSSPNPIGRSSTSRHYSYSNLPFNHEPTDAIITFDISVLSTNSLRTYPFTFVTHRKALLAYADKVSPPIPWDNWGTTRCRWFMTHVLAGTWITVSDGQRYGFLPHTLEMQEKAPIYTMDFNQYKIRQLFEAQKQSKAAQSERGKQIQTDDNSDSVPSGDDEQDVVDVQDLADLPPPPAGSPPRPIERYLGIGPLVDVTPADADPALSRVFCGSREVAVDSSVYAEPVVSRLPFLLTRTKEEFTFECCLMDATHLIGIPPLDMTDLESESTNQLDILHL